MSATSVDLLTDTPRWAYPTPGFPGKTGECRLRLWRVVDDSYGNGKAYVAVVTELDDNPGASVTNSAESIYAALCEALADEYGVDERTTVRLIEHYPRGSVARTDTYDEVTFHLPSGTRPSWTRLRRERVALILPGVDL